MKFSLRYLAGLGLCCILFSNCGGSSTPLTTGGSSSQALTLPQQIDPDLAKSDPERFAWNQFIYLTWPASSTLRGEPDPQAVYGAVGPVTFETMKADTELYSVDDTPGPYDSPEILPTGVSAQTETSTTMRPVIGIAGGNPKFLDVFDPDGVVSGFIAKDVNGNELEYEIRVNRTFYNGVVEEKLYNLQGLLDFVADPNRGSLGLPDNSGEFKASWTILEPDEAAIASRYHTTHALIEDDTTPSGYREVTLGMTGFHLFLNPEDFPFWFYATFEHVDNPQRVPSAFEFPQHVIDSDTNAINQEMQARLNGTVFANYRLVGVQTLFTSPGVVGSDGNIDYTQVNLNGEPTLLSNSQIETNFATTSSCITCHNLAAVGPPSGSGTDGDLPSIFSIFKDEGSSDQPVGFVGIETPVNPDGDPTSTAVFPPAGYKQLDFCFSIASPIFLKMAEDQ